MILSHKAVPQRYDTRKDVPCQVLVYHSGTATCNFRQPNVPLWYSLFNWLFFTDQSYATVTKTIAKSDISHQDERNDDC